MDTRPSEQAFTQHVDAPSAEPVAEPIAEPATEPVVEPVAEPVAEQPVVQEPITQEPEQPIAVVEPVAETPVEEPVSEEPTQKTVPPTIEELRTGVLNEPVEEAPAVVVPETEEPQGETKRAAPAPVQRKPEMHEIPRWDFRIQDSAGLHLPLIAKPDFTYDPYPDRTKKDAVLRYHNNPRDGTYEIPTHKEHEKYHRQHDENPGEEVYPYYHPGKYYEDGRVLDHRSTSEATHTP